MHYLFPIITEDQMLGGGPRQDPHGSPFRSILRSRSPSPASPLPLSAMPLTWALTMLPYNRLEALRRSVLVPIKQTQLPCEFIIVNSSPSRPSSREDIQETVLQTEANVRVHYLQSPIGRLHFARRISPIFRTSAGVIATTSAPNRYRNASKQYRLLLVSDDVRYDGIG